MAKKIAFLGIDLGTTGLRSILADENGNILSENSTGVEEYFIRSTDERNSEQDPTKWGPALFKTINPILSDTGGYELIAITVDSTSGTILPIDDNFKPLCNAFLHNDIRAQDEAVFIGKNTELVVKPSFALSKILWIKNWKPEIFNKAEPFILVL